MQIVTFSAIIVTKQNISERNVMVLIAAEIFEDDGLTRKLYGIRWGGNSFCFTENKAEAESLLCFINENGVEENHLADLIEDLFYT